MLSPPTLHEAKSIFCHQVQFFIFFLPPEFSDFNPGVDGERVPNIFARGDTNALSPTLHDNKSVFCHQV